LQSFKRAGKSCVVKLPPHTPAGVLRELSKKPDVRSRIACGWIIVGFLMMLFVGAMAVAHYVYGVPIQNNDTGKPETPAETFGGALFLGGGGMLFFTMGLLLRRWK
jgi:hypothetical protein